MVTVPSETVDQMLLDIERSGWRLSNLCHIAGPQQYSCILERKKRGEDGMPVYAMSAILPTARQAVSSAWAAARKPVEHPTNVVKRAGASTKPEPEVGSLSEYLGKHLFARLALEDAALDLLKAHGGEGPEDDDFI